MLSEFKKQLKSTIEASLEELSLPPQTILLEIPGDKKNGEYSCNVAMRLAGILKKNPLELANRLAESVNQQIQKGPLQAKILKIEAVRPGFINIYLTPSAVCEILVQILKEGKKFGAGQIGQGQKVQIEFVSANPTGPLSVAHARQAAVGDALGNILAFIGFQVTKEYYVNDEGNQINILGRSIAMRARELLGETTEFPEDNYQGEYIKDMAGIFMQRHQIKLIDELDAQTPEAFSQFGVDYLMDIIRAELNDFGVRFDVWSHQSKIATTGQIEKVVALLRERGFIYEHEGAVWFKSTDLGDDKDRVVQKSDGSYTYLTPDIVYHKDKLERGFQKILNIWGPDHHGYIPRLTAAVEALGFDPKILEVLIVQLATIFRNGKPLSMSTRRGQYISLREVMDEVGVDASRFFFLMRHIKAHLEFDLELAKKETAENPVYYIQYAHARIHSILNAAREANLKVTTFGFELIRQEEELDLIKKLGQFPDMLAICHSQWDPFTLVNYLQEVATVFHKFYDRHKVLDPNPALASQRLALIEATRIILSTGLSLLGVSAPERM